MAADRRHHQAAHVPSPETPDTIQPDALDSEDEPDEHATDEDRPHAESPGRDAVHDDPSRSTVPDSSG